MHKRVAGDLEGCDPRSGDTPFILTPEQQAMLAAGLADAAAGRTVSEEAVWAWLDSVGTDHELPVPKSGR